jgi:hypothetical protein
MILRSKNQPVAHPSGQRITRHARMLWMPETKLKPPTTIIISLVRFGLGMKPSLFNYRNHTHDKIPITVGYVVLAPQPHRRRIVTVRMESIKTWSFAIILIPLRRYDFIFKTLSRPL